MQKQEKKTVRLLRIRPSVVDTMVMVGVEVVEKEVDFSKDDLSMLDFYYEHTECDCIDIVSFGGLYNANGFSVVCDDEGLLKSGNVVMKYALPIDDELHELKLSGSILIGKCDYIEGREDDGMYEVGLTDEQLDYIQENLQYKLLGVTR